MCKLWGDLCNVEVEFIILEYLNTIVFILNTIFYSNILLKNPSFPPEVSILKVIVRFS